MTRSIVVVLLASLLGCAREEAPAVPPEIATLASDALRAASDVKVRGDVEAVLREHPLAPRYRAAMTKHFALMQKLHGVGLRSGIRYPRASVSVRHDRFCESGGVAHLVVTAAVRYDMEGAGSPPYTASQEEHVFRLERRGGVWTIAHHHEITLEEMHRREILKHLRNPCTRNA